MTEKQEYIKRRMIDFMKMRNFTQGELDSIEFRLIECWDIAVQSVYELVNAEIDCVKSGNRCSPEEQESALLSLIQVQERIKGVY